jgi:hypothetical protein
MECGGESVENTQLTLTRPIESRRPDLPGTKKKLE